MIKKSIAVLLLVLAVYWSFYALLPNKISDIDTELSGFSTARALVHLEAISKQPHYVGSPEHAVVKDYIIEELEKLGLETQIQEGYDISRWGNLTKPKNILARIKGSHNTKALLLLSHYDSSPHSSFGASDAGSGVVTILEGIRAFLSDGKTPKNDIIIFISDSEELGLNGASLFVNKHPWSKDVGLVLNFEARGSGGPSYMLIETNGGNANLMKQFVEANPKFPVANSLAYSIYKMLPNDTDLTRFRVDGDIDGFNFAFIDDHYDYHTALDTYERLDRKTLEHQGSYLMPLLNYFSNANLSNLKSDADYIYFNAPLVKTVIYPFSWIFPMLILAMLIFTGLIIYGKRKRKLHYKEIVKGFVAFTTSLIISGLVSFVLWKYVIKSLYSNYGEMLHGFTYNGHTYIWAFVLLTLAICFCIYNKVYKARNTGSLLVAPIFFWILICTYIAFELKGASFFIIPVFFALISLFVLIKQGKPSLIIMALLCFPVLMIMSPFIKMFPVGLGLGILFGSSIIVVLIFSFSLPVVGFFRHKKRWSYLFFTGACVALLMAHFSSDFSDDRPKPNSMIYTLDTDTNSAEWLTYDSKLDIWTQSFLGDNPNKVTNENTMSSKYNNGFTYSQKAELKPLVYPSIEIYKDTIIGAQRHVSIYIESKRPINRYEVFSPDANKFFTFKINGISPKRRKGDTYAFQNKYRNRLFSYYVSDNEPLTMEFSIPKDQVTKFELYEASFDLTNNRLFSISKRESSMIPKPFVLNDAVVLKKTISID